MHHRHRAATVLLSALLLAALDASAVGWDDYELGEFYRLSQVQAPAVHRAASAVVTFQGATGFVISPDGWILTNHHVYQSFGPSGTVVLERRPGGANRRLKVRFVMADEARDVALYKTGAKGLPYLPVRHSAPRVGEPVFIIGHPHSRPQRVSFGTVLAKGVDIAGKRSVEYSAQTWWGSSGSPVIDKRGRAIAIHWGWDAEGVSNGRLTGIPLARITRVIPRIGRVVTDRFPPSRRATARSCADGSNYEIKTRLVRSAVATNRAGRSLDKVTVHLASRRPECLAAIGSVRYRLHPTFQPPTIRGRAAESGFGVSLRAWGAFKTTAELSFPGARRPVEVQGWVRWQ